MTKIKPRINLKSRYKKALKYRLSPIKIPNKDNLMLKTKSELIKIIISYYGVMTNLQNKYIYVTNEINFLKRKLNLEIKNTKLSTNKTELEKLKTDLKNLNLKDSIDGKNEKICKCGDTTENENNVCDNCNFLENLEREKETEKQNGIND